jgi:adenylate cyclase class 2
MAIEIELKARLDDPEPVKRRLGDLGTYCGSYEKNDIYWAAAEGDVPFPGLPRSGVRLRREITTGPEGRAAETALVTYKIREMRDDIEINDEREFTVSSAGTFEDLLGRLGLKPGVRKEKRGRAWTIAGAPPALAELSMVTGLGWFLELEIMAETRDEQTLGESRKRLLSLLEQLGIPQEHIERRTYSEMLALSGSAAPPLC